MLVEGRLVDKTVITVLESVAPIIPSGEKKVNNLRIPGSSTGENNVGQLDEFIVSGRLLRKEGQSVDDVRMCPHTVCVNVLGTPNPHRAIVNNVLTMLNLCRQVK